MKDSYLGESPTFMEEFACVDKATYVVINIELLDCSYSIMWPILSDSL